MVGNCQSISKTNALKMAGHHIHKMEEANQLTSKSFFVVFSFKEGDSDFENFIE